MSYSPTVPSTLFFHTVYETKKAKKKQQKKQNKTRERLKLDLVP